MVFHYLKMPLLIPRGSFTWVLLIMFNKALLSVSASSKVLNRTSQPGTHSNKHKVLRYGSTCSKRGTVFWNMKKKITMFGWCFGSILKVSYLSLFADGCISDVTGAGLGLLAVYLRWVLDPPPQVHAVNLVKSAQEDAQTVSVYMFGLVLLTIAFLFAARRTILQMAVTVHAILFGQRRR